MEIEIKPRKVVQFLLVLAVGFTLLHIAGQFTAIYLGRTIMFSLFNLEIQPKTQF
jgi:hypothetical protein